MALEHTDAAVVALFAPIKNDYGGRCQTKISFHLASLVPNIIPVLPCLANVHHCQCVPVLEEIPHVRGSMYTGFFPARIFLGSTVFFLEPP